MRLDYARRMCESRFKIMGVMDAAHDIQDADLWESMAQAMTEALDAYKPDAAAVPPVAEAVVDMTDHGALMWEGTCT